MIQFLRENPWISGFFGGLSVGIMITRYYTMKQYFGVEDRVIEAMKKESVMVVEGDQVFVVKDGQVNQIHKKEGNA